MIEADQQWMQHALTLAERAAALNEVPVGAVVVSDDRVVGEGWNRPISSHDPTAHAEIMALRDACARVGNYRLVDCSLYVTIEPCTMCFGAMVHARVARVVFGAPEPKAGVLCSHHEVMSAPIYNHRFEWLGGVMEEECAQLMQTFFQRRREEKKRKSTTHPAAE